MGAAGYRKINVIGHAEFTKQTPHDNKEMLVTDTGEELPDLPASAEFYYASQHTRFPYEL